MSSILPASLLAIIQYYLTLWRTPCPSISFLLLASESRILFACYKAIKWFRRIILQQGTELDRIIRRRGDVQSSLAGQADASDGNIDAGELDEPGSSDEIRLLHAQDHRERRRDLYAKWRTDCSISHSNTLKDQQATLYSKDTTNVSDATASDIATSICVAKNIAPRQGPRLSTTLVDIQSINAQIRTTLYSEKDKSYSKSDQHYQSLLKRLWRTLHYDPKKVTYFDGDGDGSASVVSITTKNWQDLGFQGADPSTDWRSSGRLGLKCMLFIGDMYARDDEARSIVKQAIKGVHGDGATLGWYPFALSCITIVDFLLRLLPLHSLSYLFLSSWPSTVEETFCHISALLVKHFHEHWIYLQTSDDPIESVRARPVVMDYERISKKWKIEVRKWLERGKIGGWVDSRGLVFIDWDDAHSSPSVAHDSEKSPMPDHFEHDRDSSPGPSSFRSPVSSPQL